MKQDKMIGIVHPTRQAGIGWGRMFGYGSGSFALAVLGLIVVVNLQFFYTDYVGLAARYTGIALLVAKAFDAITDPLMGYLSDHTNTRWGRRRPYIVGAAIPLGIAFYFLFSPPVFENPQDHQQYLWLYMLGCYMATYFFWTVAAIPYASLGAELTDDYHERVKLFSIREVFTLTGLVTATVFPGFMIHYYGGRTGYSYMAAVLGGVMVVFMVITAATTSERKGFSGRKAMGPFSSWALTFKNFHFRRMLAAFILSSIAATLPQILIIYIATYIVGMPEWWNDSMPGWLPPYSFYLLFYFGGGALALPLWLQVARFLGKRNTWGIAIVVSALGSIGCSFLDYGTVFLYCGLLSMLGAAYGNYMVMPSSIVADIIDWDEAETDCRREGSYFAIWAFSLKCCTAVTGFSAMMMLHRIGYAPGVQQTEVVRTWMLGMYSWFPATFYMLSALLLLRFNFTHTDLQEVHRKLGRAQEA